MILEEDNEEEENQQSVGRADEGGSVASENDMETSVEKLPELENSLKSNKSKRKSNHHESP